MKKYLMTFIYVFLITQVYSNDPQAEIETNLGTFKVQLYFSKTPKTVLNFVRLSQKRFYDEIIFHRIIKGFMSQTGDPTGTGRGGPGYTFEDEIVPELKHDKKGILSMANRGPDTNGSQFFITAAPTPHLDGKHTVFGEVISGMDVVDSINSVETNAQNKPLKKVQILSIVIEGLMHPVVDNQKLSEINSKAEKLMKTFLLETKGAKLKEYYLEKIRNKGAVFLFIWKCQTDQDESYAFWMKSKRDQESNHHIIEAHINKV